jgi:hypothetical protein
MAPRAQLAYASARNTLSEIAAERQPCRGCQLRRSAGSDHAAGTEEHEPIADALGIAELVDGEQQGAATQRLVSQQAHDLACLPQIEAVKRLIHQQHGERRQQPERQQQPASISLGQSADRLGEGGLQTKRAHKLGESLRCLLICLAKEPQDFRRPLVRVGRDSLGHIEQPLLALGGRQRRTPPSHFAGIDGEQTRNAFEQCCFARAIRPDQA